MLSSFSVPSDVAEEYANSVVILWAIHQCCFHRNKSLRFPNAVPHECILPKFFWIQELGWALLYWQLCDHKLFSVCISSFSFLILHCCLSAERIWNIYQGIVRWRHNFYMVMLLAFEITLCNGGQNKLSVETVFMFLPTEWHKYVFLLTFAVRWIWFLWRRSFTSGWFKMQLLSSQMGI